MINQLFFLAKHILSVMDLTTLNNNDTEETIISLCHHAQTTMGNTAAICLYPRFIPIARQTLDDQGSKDIGIATVINFPHGNDCLEDLLEELSTAIDYGANEVDMVFPYRALIAGNETIGLEMVEKASKLCHNQQVLLKVIIESGELRKSDLIRRASQIVIAGSADFIKTSTGKALINTTLESTSIILNTIIDEDATEKVGCKIAGGIKTIKQAVNYLTLTRDLMGENWINPKHFRFGASSLLDKLLRCYINNTLPSKTIL